MADESCGQCGKREEEGETFSHCSRCKIVTYCSKACQKQHWRGGHKDTCQAASEREDTVKKTANETVHNDNGPSKASKKNKKKAKPPSSSGGAPAAKEQNPKQKPSSRRVTARSDATGAPLSFGKHDNCAICLDTMRNPIRLPSCGHWYCKECVERLRQVASAKDVCPVCREPLPPGPEKLFDEAVTKYMRVQRKVERLGRSWSNMPRALQREMDEVRELYEQAADQGDEVAMNNLGFMYENGEGVAQSYVKARDWKEPAAEGGLAHAQNVLGSCYLLGSLVVREW